MNATIRPLDPNRCDAACRNPDSFARIGDVTYCRHGRIWHCFDKGEISLRAFWEPLTWFWTPFKLRKAKKALGA